MELPKPTLAKGVSLLCFLFLACISTLAADASESPAASWKQPEVTEVGRGVWRVRFGQPEKFTPDAVRELPPKWEGMAQLPEPGKLPFAPADLRCRVTSARTVLYVPCDEPEDQIYGFGLDPAAYEQKGLRKYLSVCAAVMEKTGASHGPVPFWLSTRGYGVYVDTARVPFVHVARLSARSAVNAEGAAGDLKTDVAALYAARPAAGKAEVVVEIPGNTSGVDVYLFAGPTPREAVQRYNLFSGGGCLPPMWGLGMKYRAFTGADEATVTNLARALRDRQIPCDMLGLEPGWQSRAYSCSLVWDKKRFPSHEAVVTDLNRQGFKINLWEHAYINPESPLFAPLKPRSGDFLVWGGLVVDFADPQAFQMFSEYHGKNFIDQGIAGFKADECDNQPLTDCTPFNFPYSSIFPSGIDGEQMIQLYGYYYQRSIQAAFRARNLRTWGDVRATTALAAPLPFNLYSDAYQFDQYLRQLVNASFTGLLWSPEVRDASSYDDLLNRLALSSFAAQMCVNVWFMPHPIWEQYDHDKNNKHQLLPETDQERIATQLREIVNFRYRLLPYLYAAFQQYHDTGLPPVRSPLLDFPEDRELRKVDNEFLFGSRLLVAPFVSAESTREVYLPKGCNWIEFKTGKLYAGGTKLTVKGKAGEAPLFVRENTLLPWAEPVQRVGTDTVFNVTMKVFGSKPEPCMLFEDDGESYRYEQGTQNRLTLTWANGQGTVAKTGNFPGSRYRIQRWEPVAIQP